jgi:hypothetical protein
MGTGRAWQVGLAALLLAVAGGCARQGNGAGSVEARLYESLRQGRHICGLLEDGSGLALWAHQVDGRQLRGVLLKHHDATGAYDLIVSAREAALHVDAERGALVLHLQKGAFRGVASTGHFDDRIFSFPFAEAPARRD